MRNKHESTPSGRAKVKTKRPETVGMVGNKKLTYDRKEGSIMLAGSPRGKVTNVQRDILNTLLKHPLQTVHHERLYRACLHLPKGYTEDPVAVRTYLKPTMHRLRERLGQIHAPLKRVIRAAYGKGYMYIPDSSVKHPTRIK